MPYQHPLDAGGGAILLIFHGNLRWLLMHQDHSDLVEVGNLGPMMKSFTLPEFAQNTEELRMAFTKKWEIAQRIAFPE